MWWFQFYLTGQAHALLQSRLAENTMAVDAKQFEVLEKYSQVVKFILRTCTAREVVAEAHKNVVIFRKGSKMTEES